MYKNRKRYKNHFYIFYRKESLILKVNYALSEYFNEKFCLKIFPLNSKTVRLPDIIKKMKHLLMIETSRIQHAAAIKLMISFETVSDIIHEDLKLKNDI